MADYAPRAAADVTDGRGVTVPEFMGYAEIDEFKATIWVRGRLKAQPVLSVTEGGVLQMRGDEFSLEWIPGQDGWQARMLTVHGPQMDGDRATGAQVMRHYFLAEPDTPYWVRALAAQCTPPQAPPRPARTEFGLDTTWAPKLCGYCAAPIVAERRRSGQWYVHVKNGNHRCPDGSGNDCNTLVHAKPAMKED